MTSIREIMVLALLSLAVLPVAEVRAMDVGVARVDVSPDTPIRLNGYGARSKESAGIEQRIWAKALAIGSDAEGARVLISVDNLGVPDAIVEEVAARLKRRAGIPRERFVVSSSHTHSAPCVSGCADNLFGRVLSATERAAIDRYTKELTGKLEEVALAALAERLPSELAWSQGRVGFAANRRTRGGPVDHAMPVLRVTRPGGKIRALLVNYACHCTTVMPADNTIHGDWAGCAQEAIERDNPGAIALTVVGCGADSNPTPREVRGAAEQHGRAIADEVGRLLKAERWTSLEAPPVTKFRRVKLPFDTLPTRAQLMELVKAGGAAGYNASTHLARLDRGEPLQEALDYPVQTWQFGDRLVMVFLAGEVVVDYALRLKQELDASRVWITAYTNDVPCYIPSERILREGGYEGKTAMIYYGRPTRLKPGIEDLIVSVVLDLIPPVFRVDPKAKDTPPHAKSAEESRKSIKVRPGLRVELVASEPLVLSPVAIDFGADGSLWVCEMRDYPTGIDRRGKPGGVIKRLRDLDGDGRYDSAINFLEGVPFPTGVMAWRKGVLVCSAPNIFYAEDTDGDGKADLKRVLYEGFSGENFQGRVNGLSYNLDNWVYGGSGGIASVGIRSTVSGKEIKAGYRDFRILPDTGALEPAAGTSQSGRIHDDWGDQFGNNSGTWLFHFPIPDHAARRNPWVLARRASVEVPREVGNERVYPISRTLERFNDPLTADHATSACGPCIYRDTLLGAEYANNLFVCEPVHNLVHREILSSDGATFASRRDAAERTSEFLASSDNWFRPVQVRTGPGGALYVVDMYRFVIEHPRWIGPDRLANLDVRAGEDKGRIYRVVAEGHPARKVPDLDRLATPALAEAMDSPNGTLRDNVQRLLVHRSDRSAAPALEKLLVASPLPAVRSQALCALEGLGALTPGMVRTGLADAHPGVRRQAIRLGGAWLGKDETLSRTILGLVDDPDATVRFQLALSLGDWNDSRAADALARLAITQPADRWLRAAVLSSAATKGAAILSAVISAGADRGTRSELIGPLIKTLIGSGIRGELTTATAAMTRPDSAGTYAPWRFSALAEVLDSGASIEPSARSALGPIFEAARRTASDPNADPADRSAAIGLIGRDDADRTLLTGLLAPRNRPEVRSAAARSLIRMADDKSTEGVLASWGSLGPSLRSECLDLLLARPASALVLLGSLKSAAIDPAEIDAAHRQRLVEHDDTAVRSQATQLFASLRTRQDVVDSFRPVLSRSGDSTRGESVFARLCAGCHKLDGKGHEVGPDLAALTDKGAAALAVAILDPNREVEAQYLGVTAALKDGRILTGLIASEIGNTITLKRQDGLSDAILRTDLDAIKSSGRSIMPEGLENDLKGSDLADIIAYIAGHDRAKRLDGNRPELIAQQADGTIRLTANKAEIYGTTLTFESEFQNLGHWNSVDDRAVWSIRLDRPTSFTVAMEWACADDSAGNRFRIAVAGGTIEGLVGGTSSASWANYRSIFVGELSLPEGTHRLEFRAAGPIRGALLDLKTITLSPRTE